MGMKGSREKTCIDCGEDYTVGKTRVNFGNGWCPECRRGAANMTPEYNVRHTVHGTTAIERLSQVRK